MCIRFISSVELFKNKLKTILNSDAYDTETFTIRENFTVYSYPSLDTQHMSQRNFSSRELKRKGLGIFNPYSDQLATRYMGNTDGSSP